MAGRGVCLSVAEANGRLQRRGKTSLPVPFEPLRNDKFVLHIPSSLPYGFHFG